MVRGQTEVILGKGKRGELLMMLLKDPGLFRAKCYKKRLVMVEV